MAHKAITFDPTRLISLARIRDTKRAVLRDLSSRYEDLRNQRNDAQRRASLTAQHAQDTFGPPRVAADKQAKAAQDRVDALTARMTSVQTEMDALVGDVGVASGTFKAALNFAVEQGLAIPDALAAEADGLHRNVMPRVA